MDMPMMFCVYSLPGNFGNPSSMNTSRRMNAHAATPHTDPSSTKAIASCRPNVPAKENWMSDTANAGSGPIKIRPMRRRGARRDDDGQKRAVRDLRQQDFQREQHAAERRVEGRRDTRAGPCREQRDLLPGRQPDHLRERGAQRRADLDDRPFAARPQRRCRSIAPRPAP